LLIRRLRIALSRRSTASRCRRRPTALYTLRLVSTP
jgi:hypothetical protein